MKTITYYFGMIRGRWYRVSGRTFTNTLVYRDDLRKECFMKFSDGSMGIFDDFHNFLHDEDITAEEVNVEIRVV